MERKINSPSDLFRRKSQARLSEHQTRALVNRIPALQNLFVKKEEEVVEDFSDLVAHLSRFKHSIAESEEEAPAPIKIREKKRTDLDVSESIYEVLLEEETVKEKTPAISAQAKKDKRRLAMSLASLAAKPEMRQKLVRDGAIGVLLDMSAMSDRAIQRSCVSAFCSLSNEPTLRGRMIEEGAMGAVVSLSSIVHNAIVFESLKTLCNLCMEPNAEIRAIKDGVPFAVMHAISIFPNCVEVCLKTLLNLTYVSERYQRIEEIADSLMHFNGFALSTESEILVASAICNLSALKNFQLRLVEDGCLKFVERVVVSQNRQLRILGARIIDNLTTDSRTRGKMVDNGIIPLLLIMSRDDIEEVRTHTVKAFYNLARDMICREKIVNANAVTVIVKLSSDTIQNVLLGRTASRILRILCADSRIANKLVKDGIIRALMNLLRTDDEVIQQFCAESICSLFQIEDVKGRLIEQGAVGILVQLSQNTVNPVTSEWCAFALFHLASGQQCPRKMLEAAILPCVIKLCDFPTDNTKYFCAATLDLISQMRDVDISIGIPVLVHMLRTNTNSDNTKTFCASAIYNLADRDENCKLILDSGALLPVVDLTARGSTETKKKCAAILSKLSIQSDFHRHFNSGNVLRVLLDLSNIDDVYTQRKVIMAISNLSQSKELREQLLTLNPIPYIMTLASRCDENVRRGCASIVCNLAYEHGSEQIIANAGIVSTLLITAMITSDQLDSKIICVKAFVNLMADESLYQNMVKDGLIWGLSSLANLGDPEIRVLCLKALSKLSHNFAVDMLASTPCVRTVTKAVDQTKDIELTRFAARTLTNLLVKSTNADVDFRQLAVGCLQHLADSQDNEISEICVLCLCLASQSEPCRDSIMRAGLLTKIDASSIFTIPRVCSAYITMFENIALNPSSRSEIVDEKCIYRFTQICSLNDVALRLSVGRCLYYITCCQKNIPLIIEQNVLFLIDLMLNEVDYEGPEFELTKLLISAIYNLSTLESMHFTLVKLGIVKVLKRMWEQSQDEFKPCALIIRTVCHLSCGQVNSAKLVADGCGEMLCFVEHHKQADYPACNFNFNIDLLEWVAMSMRNLLSVVSNQEKLIQQGCLEVIIALAEEALVFLTDSDSFTASRLRSTKTVESSRFSRKISTSPTKLRKDASQEHYAIRNHCISALRSLTFNEKLRPLLVDSGGLNLILDGENQVDEIPHSLLIELEKESWQNGSRGPQKEARVACKRLGDIDLSLLGTTRKLNVEDVKIVTPPLEKFHVSVDVGEVTGISTSRIGLGHIALGIDNLASYGDSDEYDVTSIMSCPKRDATNDDCAAVDVDKPDTISTDMPMSPMSPIGPTNALQTPQSGQIQANQIPLMRHVSGNNSIHSGCSDEESELSHLALPTGGGAVIQRRGSRDGIVTKHVMPHISTSEIRGHSAGPRRLKALGLIPSTARAGSGARPKTAGDSKRQQPDKAFKNLISLIKLSKASKGELLGTVMDEWKAVSKY